MSDPNEIAGLTDCDNGSLPASPCKLELNNGFVASFHGLSKRELFAAMAMQGLLANPDVMIGMRDASKDLGMDSDALVAGTAREVADALLAELAKPQEGSAS